MMPISLGVWNHELARGRVVSVQLVCETDRLARRGDRFEPDRRLALIAPFASHAEECAHCVENPPGAGRLWRVRPGVDALANGPGFRGGE